MLTFRYSEISFFFLDGKTSTLTISLTLKWKIPSGNQVPVLNYEVVWLIPSYHSNLIWMDNTFHCPDSYINKNLHHIVRKHNEWNSSLLLRQLHTASCSHTSYTPESLTWRVKLETYETPFGTDRKFPLGDNTWRTLRNVSIFDNCAFGMRFD